MEITKRLDPAHQAIDLFDQDIVRDVWRDKYRYGNENHPFASHQRTSETVMAPDGEYWIKQCYEFMCAGIWMPGGRILAGAGTAKNVTLFNCAVSRTIPDSMEGISDALKESAMTLRQGGGIGHDFSTLRPKGAKLTRLGEGSMASGPVSFMEVFDVQCKTIMSAGARRGAMMATLRDDHPDLLEFINAKHEKGVLTNFNVSILISEAFMEAVEDDATWDLGFHIPPVDNSHLTVHHLDDGVDWYVYSRHRARELWDLILKSTYEYSEPGVIFIDRINDINNLKYCEEIRSTNPCGEQPLPPYGVCNLGAINLARLVRNPFTERAEIDWDLLREAVYLGVKFLDNVIDISRYALDEQAIEEKRKRRIGLGISGLADMMAQLQHRYGSIASASITDTVMMEISVYAYKASIGLAKERGSFPLFKHDEYLNGTFAGKMGPIITDAIRDHGIRNGLILTVAPTGTTSIYYGNISSGIEPVFRHVAKRNVRQADKSWKSYTTEGYGYRLFKALHSREPNETELGGYMVTADKLTTLDHIRIQAAVQKYIDASVSKTINCRKDMDFADFKTVYQVAYETGCKGCTTYRPSPVRGSILEAAEEEPQKPKFRPLVLQGKTYKIKWPTYESAFYFTINHDEEGKPYECFISSKSGKNVEFTTALTVLMSALMREGKDVKFLVDEFAQISSSEDSAWIGKKHWKSVIHYIGHILEQHLNGHGEKLKVNVENMPEGRMMSVDTIYLGDQPLGVVKDVTLIQEDSQYYNSCPKCGVHAFEHKEGCGTCLSCGYTTCG